MENRLKFRVTLDKISGEAVGNRSIYALVFIATLFFAAQTETPLIAVTYQIKQVVP